MSGPTDGKVVQLKLAQRGYSQQAVEIFEELLEKAKSGAITEVTVLWATADGTVNHSASGSDDLIRQLGWLARMQHTINVRITEAG